MKKTLLLSLLISSVFIFPVVRNFPGITYAKNLSYGKSLLRGTWSDWITPGDGHQDGIDFSFFTPDSPSLSRVGISKNYNR